MPKAGTQTYSQKRESARAANHDRLFLGRGSAAADVKPRLHDNAILVPLETPGLFLFSHIHP